jgi:pyruvate-formate lyase-activating enzyme
MAGAMAGSAILAAATSCARLSTVTLTINNDCNLSCPHCYLQYEGRGGVVSPATLKSIFESSCERICVVGKEPLANRSSIETVRALVWDASARSKSVSLITNGLNAALLPAETVRALAWIDISLDGGPRTYGAYRQGSWPKLLRAVSALRANGCREIRLLQTISRETAGAIDDMLDAHAELGADLTLFSPFQPTRSHGSQRTSAISPVAVVDALAPYAARADVMLAADGLYASPYPEAESAFARARQLFGDRFVFVSSDPIDRGLIRVTYDGLVMTPFQAVDTADYATKGRPLEAAGLDAAYEALYAESTPRVLH